MISLLNENRKARTELKKAIAESKKEKLKSEVLYFELEQIRHEIKNILAAGIKDAERK